jgi:hypothetical protein
VKLALGMRLRQGPWGGGNRFAQSLVEGLRAEGIDVVDSLDAPDIDVILLTDPRQGSQSASFEDSAIARYLIFSNSRAIVIHRVNECDERKGTSGINQRLIDANQLVDHTVFISSWLRDLYVAQGLPCRSLSVILNGADRRIFHPGGHRTWDGKEPLRLVTHHWGGNWNKGFDIYQRIDQLMATEPWRSRIAFTYVGNLPEGFGFENAVHVQPLDGTALVDELCRHHVYITATRNEPAGMHHVEGANCGLPLLYRDSGALPEYCQGYGVMFSGDDFEGKLSEMMASYATWEKNVRTYPHDAELMVTGYLDLIKGVYKEREDIPPRRRFSRWPRWVDARLAR